MTNQETCCQKTVSRFVENQMSPAESREFQSHLDHCDSCRQRLDGVTADESWWNEAREFLNDQCNDDLTETLSFLNASDDPRMMGRFAGYEIAGLIGQGGMGIVLKGFDDSLNRYAAIKVLAPQLATRGSSRNRFAREAQAAAAVVHDNVIAIHGVSEAAGLPYLVMPYVRGESLQKRLDRDGAMTPTEIVRIAHQIASGLAAAHSQGLVHRDIKPANILLPEGVQRVLITDFGLARAVDDSNLTGTGILAGTPQFMSPEQARGEGVDPRSDLFSLGTVMYAMCTGRNPFRANNPYGILRRIIEDQPRSIRQVNSDIPMWLVTIVSRLHEKSPDDRFQSASELADLLEKCLAHLQNPSIRLPEELAPVSSLRLNWKWCAIGALIFAMAYGAFVLSFTLKSEQQSWLAQYIPWAKAKADQALGDSGFDSPGLAVGSEFTDDNATLPNETFLPTDEQCIADLVASRDIAKQAWAAAQQRADEAAAQLHKQEYLALQKAVQQTTALAKYKDGDLDSFEALRELEGQDLLQLARDAAKENWRRVKAQYENGDEVNLQDVSAVQSQFQFFDRQVAFRQLQSEVFRQRAKAEELLERGLFSDSLATLSQVRQEISESELDDKQKEPLLTIVDRDMREINVYVGNTQIVQESESPDEVLTEDEIRLRVKLVQLSNRVTALRREGNFIESKMVEREVLLILKARDKDHTRLNEMRQEMIDLRLAGENTQADKIIEEMALIENELANRYWEIELIDDLESGVDSRLAPLREKLSDIASAGLPEETMRSRILDMQNRMADAEKQLILEYEIRESDHRLGKARDEMVLPAWESGGKVPMAIAGMGDVDQDELSDQKRLIELIVANGGTIVAQHDEKGAIKGSIDPSVRYLVLGNLNQAGEEIVKAVETLKQQALENDVEIISPDKLLKLLGIEVDEFLDIHISIKQAELAAFEAKNTLAHSKKLLAKGFVTEQQVKADQYAVEIAELELASARNSLAVAEGERALRQTEKAERQERGQSFVYGIEMLQGRDDKDTIERIEMMLEAFKPQVEQLKERLGDGHPRLEGMRKQIELWETELENLKSKAPRSDEWQKDALDSDQPSTDSLEDNDGVKHDRFDRIQLIGGISFDEAKQIDPPSDDEILELLTDYEIESQVAIVKSRLAYFIDPPFAHPLLGPVQLHHTHYKCSVYQVEKEEWPIPHSTRQTDSAKVVYVDQLQWVLH